MYDIEIDHDGELILTYDVSVNCRGRKVFHLGTGSCDVFKFYDIAEAGIPGATKVEFLWSYNVLVTLSGEALLRLIHEHYPEQEESARERIDSEKEYQIDCYDMS